MAMQDTHEMSDEAFDCIARRFRVLSEPLRLKILQMLQKGERSVGDLAQCLGTSQPNVSKHLGTLAQQGMVKRRQERTTVYYSIADPSIFELCDMVCSGISRDLERQQKMFA